MPPRQDEALMNFSLADFHRRNRKKIIEEWVTRLSAEVGNRYSERPLEELFGTCSEAFEANLHVLVSNDFSYINRFIDKITQMRLEAGFPLSDVQMAFELYRIIVIPLLAMETTIDEFHECIARVNSCLAYTIHRFSDHFQNMHEKKILEHNLRLEEEVRARTSELKESELKYKTLVEEISDGYFVIQDEVIVFANQAYCQMHGYTLDEVMGKNFKVFVEPESRKKVIDIYSKSLVKKGDPRSFEYLRLTKEGKSFLTEILAKTTRYENRLSSIGICRDITERVKMERRVRDAERMAYIGQITTSLSHEIRNPLSAVKMNLQILKKNPQLRGNDKRRTDISVKEVIRLERILEELLDFARPLSLKLRPSNVNKILSSCVELLEMKFKEKGLSVLTSLESGMPDVRADGEKLGQAFINLLLNAIEASQQGGEISVKSLYYQDGPDSRVDIIIDDEGHGISKEHISDIFKPFVTTKSKGTGLGLTNVKRIVEAHGGNVEVKNRHPHGVFFKVGFPTGKDYGQDSRYR
jgi:PAS domain S-box-containing protein